MRSRKACILASSHEAYKHGNGSQQNIAFGTARNKQLYGVSNGENCLKHRTEESCGDHGLLDKLSKYACGNVWNLAVPQRKRRGGDAVREDAWTANSDPRSTAGLETDVR